MRSKTRQEHQSCPTHFLVRYNFFFKLFLEHSIRKIHLLMSYSQLSWNYQDGDVYMWVIIALGFLVSWEEIRLAEEETQSDGLCFQCFILPWGSIPLCWAPGCLCATYQKNSVFLMRRELQNEDPNCPDYNLWGSCLHSQSASRPSPWSSVWYLSCSCLSCHR